MFSYFLLCCCYLSCLPVCIAAMYISTESVRLGTLNVSTFGDMYPWRSVRLRSIGTYDLTVSTLPLSILAASFLLPVFASSACCVLPLPTVAVSLACFRPLALVACFPAGSAFCLLLLCCCSWCLLSWLLWPRFCVVGVFWAFTKLKMAVPRCSAVLLPARFTALFFLSLLACNTPPVANLSCFYSLCVYYDILWFRFMISAI